MDDIVEKFGAIEGRVAALEVGHTGSLVESRVAALEVRVNVVEMNEVKDRAQVTDLSKKVDALTITQQTQLEILKRLDAIASNPHFKVILAVVATALASWAASRGLK